VKGKKKISLSLSLIAQFTGNDRHTESFDK